MGPSLGVAQRTALEPWLPERTMVPLCGTTRIFDRMALTPIERYEEFKSTVATPGQPTALGDVRSTIVTGHERELTAASCGRLALPAEGDCPPESWAGPSCPMRMVMPRGPWLRTYEKASGRAAWFMVPVALG